MPSTWVDWYSFWMIEREREKDRESVDLCEEILDSATTS